MYSSVPEVHLTAGPFSDLFCLADAQNICDNDMVED